ncbi:response regulator [Roseibacterium sp. SDUM158017]|uniref:response regulator n=1 Tax=Roseicyclus salinarum TaxID=3036773 RepID=UPI002415654C|nr:response regulator [Roseibacterium sp. SDUM158017]MDG4649269.1 response regulator [Roseibacterium sp. SDUM158017]
MDTLERILFVEDDPDVHPLIELALERLGGFEVHGFMSGEEAVARAAEIDPQLVLLDVMMPGMDGPETFRALRRLDGFATKPLAFLTAKVARDDIDRLHALGAAAVLSKPFDPMTLAARIRDIWATHHATA